MSLHEKRGFFGIKPHGYQQRITLLYLCPQLYGILPYRYRVQVYNAVSTVVLFLELNPVHHCEIIPQMRRVCRLYAAEYLLFLSHVFLLILMLLSFIDLGPFILKISRTVSLSAKRRTEPQPVYKG